MSRYISVVAAAAAAGAVAANASASPMFTSTSVTMSQASAHLSFVETGLAAGATVTYSFIGRLRALWFGPVTRVWSDRAHEYHVGRAHVTLKGGVGATLVGTADSAGVVRLEADIPAHTSPSVPATTVWLPDHWRPVDHLWSLTLYRAALIDQQSGVRSQLRGRFLWADPSCRYCR